MAKKKMIEESADVQDIVDEVVEPDFFEQEIAEPEPVVEPVVEPEPEPAPVVANVTPSAEIQELLKQRQMHRDQAAKFEAKAATARAFEATIDASLAALGYVVESGADERRYQ